MDDPCSSDLDPDSPPQTIPSTYPLSPAELAMQPLTYNQHISGVWGDQILNDPDWVTQVRSTVGVTKLPPCSSACQITIC